MLASFSTGDTVRDAGDGTFSGLSESLGQMRVDYDTGAVYALNPATAPPFGSIKAHPAAALSRSPFSADYSVTQSNRGAVWTALLRPVPAPGATVLSYRALGRWYELRDQGDGILRGDEGAGVGSINFATGSLNATLGALPDENTSVIINWGISEGYFPITNLSPAVADDGGAVPEIKFTLPVGGVEPGSFAFKKSIGDPSAWAIDDGNGNIVGTTPAVGGALVSGSIIYATGEVVVRSPEIPAPGSIGQATWDGGISEEETFNAIKSGSTVSLSLAGAPIAPGTLSLKYDREIVTAAGPRGSTRRLRDDGSGALEDFDGNPVTGSSVNYSTGLVTFNPDYSAPATAYEYGSTSQQMPSRTPIGPRIGPVSVSVSSPLSVTLAPRPVTFIDGTAVIVSYRKASTSPAGNTFNVPFSQLRIDLTRGSILPLLPGSVSFELSDNPENVFVERNGSLYRNLNSQTNAGTLAGTLDLDTGIATITDWYGSFSYSAKILGGLVRGGQIDLPVTSGRAPGSPLRPASFSLRALRAEDGQEIFGTADVNGNIQTAEMHGYVDVNSSVYTVAFGSYVLDSSLTPLEKSEPWYDPANVDGDGYIWWPKPAIPGSVRINCVVQVSTPLDPDIIGINPVRLPLDGRGQVVRPADTLVLLESLPETLPGGLAAGQVIPLPRGNLDSVSLYDQAGLGIPDAFYEVDRVAGEITMATPLDLSGYTQPLVAIHRAGEPLLVTDVEIGGRVTLAQQLSRNYDKDISTASTALVVGNVAARYESLFEQNTWMTEWTDNVVGGPPTSGAQYNELLYPVLVTNHGAITQRWALIFTSSSGGNVVGEELGVIGTFDLINPVAPINPATVGSPIGTTPYFQVSPDGFGAGWATGNVIRFNTIAAGAPIWLSRTVRPGASSVIDDRARLQLRWNKD